MNIYDFNNDLYAVFETARSSDDILTLCGYWLHVPDLNLALVGSVEKNLGFSSSPADNQKIEQLGLLNARSIFWICGEDPIKLEIREGGRIDMPDGSRAEWSISGDFLVLSGLSNLPLASFRLSAGLAVPYRSDVRCQRHGRA